jgi:sialic acid synthase SpsE
MFLSTPFDHDSIDMLNELKLPTFKIPSGEITNLPYLRHIGSLKKEIILSTGMSDIGEIEDALDILVKAGTLKENITVLHANTMYPTPMVKAIRNIELALGSGEKKPSKSEMSNIETSRKSIVANCAIKKGEVFNETNLAVKRPANGISLMQWDNMMGAIANKDYQEDELI